MFSILLVLGSAFITVSMALQKFQKFLFVLKRILTALFCGTPLYLLSINKI